MAQTLKTSYTLAGLVVGVPNVHAHGLNWNPSRPVVPDLILLTGSGYTVTADNTNITVTRGASAADTVTVYAESWHSIERAFGPVSLVKLTPQPIVIQSGGSSGGSSSDQAFQVAVDHTTDPNGFDVALPVAMPDATYIPEVTPQFPTVNDATQPFVLSRTNATLRLGALANFADGTILFITIKPKTN